MREMTFATWTGRLAFVVFVPVLLIASALFGFMIGLLTALSAVFVLTLGASWLLDLVEPTDHRYARLAARQARVATRRGRPGRRRNKPSKQDRGASPSPGTGEDGL